MKESIEAAGTLIEDGIELVSPHLRWLIRNAALSHCGGEALNVISYHKNIPTDNWGEAIPIVKGIAINLTKHFEEALETIIKAEQPCVSLRFFLLSDLIDTALHEAHHLKAALEHNSYEDPNIEQEESKQIAKTKLFQFAEEFDVEIFTFGKVIDELLQEIITAFKEDITPKDDDPNFKSEEWKRLQVYMWDHKLAFYDPDEKIQLGMRALFEAQIPNKQPWTSTPVSFIDNTKIENVAEQTPVLPINQPMQQPINNNQTPETYYGDDDDMVCYQQMPQQFVQSPQNTLSVADIKIAAETVLRTLFWHVVNKCEFNREGGWNNPTAILEPVNITHIPHATQLFTHMSTVDENGTAMSQIPCEGIIKGKLSAKQQLPMYELYLNMNGQLHKRTFIVQNPNKRNNEGNFSNWAQKARTGHIIMMLLEDKKPTDPPNKINLRAYITLNPGDHLGQEIYTCN